jgi:hypothetical protein
MTRRLLAAVALATLAAPAYAQNQRAAPPEVVYQQKTIIDISEDENVFGTTVDPDGDIIRVRPPAIHGSLIKNRANFIPEMLKSAEKI